MEANEAKKPKRPRIGQPVGLNDNASRGTENHYENSFNHKTESSEEGAAPRQQGYQPRQQGYNRYNQNGGYQGGYNRQQGG
ncbi:MAG: pseudouridine synthase, partial [Muribaculaceae bacterium]|nr:pseudouridine synthase [Muribaculaceae bacterium]